MQQKCKKQKEMEATNRLQHGKQRIAHVSSAFKVWTDGKREKPKSEILTIEEFERRIKDGTLLQTL